LVGFSNSAEDSEDEQFFLGEVFSDTKATPATKGTTNITSTTITTSTPSITKQLPGTTKKRGKANPDEDAPRNKKSRVEAPTSTPQDKKQNKTPHQQAQAQKVQQQAPTRKVSIFGRPKPAPEADLFMRSKSLYVPFAVGH
jgi:hypothetical protein